MSDHEPFGTFIPLAQSTFPNTCTCGHDISRHNNPPATGGQCAECRLGAGIISLAQTNHAFTPVSQINDRGATIPTRGQFSASSPKDYCVSAISVVTINPAPPGFGPARPPNGQRAG